MLSKFPPPNISRGTVVQFQYRDEPNFRTLNITSIYKAGKDGPIFIKGLSEKKSGEGLKYGTFYWAFMTNVQILSGERLP